MNPYLKNVNKIEFVVTDACTGRCRHCSQGEHTNCRERIDPQAAARAVRLISEQYSIQTVMTFGGEPMLHAEAVYAIMEVAQELGIPRRQVITNGWFTSCREHVREAAQRLSACGVNDLLLSVDAFHQETIPLAAVRSFAAEAKDCGIPIRLQPAWLVSPAHENPYNQTTRALLQSLSDLQLPVSEGNVIFPEGNAMRYLGEYFAQSKPENPYEEDPRDLRCISFSAKGDVLNGNFYRQELDSILESYTP